MRFGKLSCFATLGLVAGLIGLAPSPSEAICWWCTGNSPAGDCEMISDGWNRCEMVAGECRVNGFPCGDPQLAARESMTLADGSVVYGATVGEGAFAIQSCRYTRLAVLYSSSGAQERRELARTIVLE